MASPPTSIPNSAAVPSSGAARSTPYLGPPRYLTPPRWGFPALPWREEEPAAPRPAAEELTEQTGLLVALLRALAVLAGLSALAECWRYVLLLRSRGSALDAREVAASDALVAAVSWVSALLTAVAGVLLLIWVVRAMEASAARAGLRPARTPRSVVLGWLIPGINLSIPGSVLAEIEHVALDRDPNQRPCPSRLLRVWWALWGANVVLAVLSAGWLLRSGVQARADSVVQHALLDLVASVTAVVTVRVVSQLTALIGPPRRVPLPRVVRVSSVDVTASPASP